MPFDDDTPRRDDDDSERLFAELMRDAAFMA
jgi:hypothetical protein